MSLKLVFLGTPEIACPFLRELVASGYSPAAVITQPDRKGGRGMNFICPPLKRDAEELNISVFQPSNNEELYEAMEKIKPDLGIVIAYGLILKKFILDIPRYGFINVHFSLLPLYRGAAPVRRAILNGEKETGVTIFKIDEGMDTGPVLSQEKISIGENENAISVFNRLIELGKALLIKAVENIRTGLAIYKPQIGIPTYAPKIQIGETFLDFSQKSNKVFNKIRAFCFDPFARAVFMNKNRKIVLQIISASLKTNDNNIKIKPGCMSNFEKRKGIFIKCSEGDVFIENIKPEGGKIVNAYDYFIGGCQIKIGDPVFEVCLNGK